MLARWTARLRRLRRRFSRSEWGVYLLGLPRVRVAEHQRGLLLIQIDGLSRHQMERAVRDRRMPFLRRLRDREGFRLHTFYPGLPSSTPSVQGELHFGVRCAVPAFSFRDHESGQVFRMLDQAAAAHVQERLRSQGPGLLEGGSSYCNIYSGGAEESRFCPATIGLNNMARSSNLPRWLSVLLWHFPMLLRIAGLTIIEVGLAIYDFFTGLGNGFQISKELKFIPSRIAVAIGLREFAVMGASMDLARGLPIIHVNLLGYDEQSHRRGPSSAFAHWALKGIDGAIRRLWSEARRSPARDYDVWVFSDHGQEHTASYTEVAGKRIAQAVAEVLNEPAPAGAASHPRGVQLARSQWLGSGRIARWLQRCLGESVDAQPAAETVVTSMGPIAHVYPASELTAEQLQAAGRRLVDHHSVPMVLFVDNGRVVALNERGRFDLRDQPAEVIGLDHPALDDVAADLERLVRHPDAGALVLSGWQPGAKPLSFATENGAHAGPGTEETRGFALLPSDAPLPASEKSYLRPLDLRNAALHLLGRDTPPAYEPRGRAAPKPRRLRIMTYNVHACVGMDGRLSPMRIARVISQADVDVVALQELDVGRMRSNTVDQAHAIAHELEMEYHFHPAWQLEEERYGDAILSRVPMRLVHAGSLPRPPGRRHLEPRGAIWVELECDGQTVQLINTHLGLRGGERMQQVVELLGPRWLGNPNCQSPAILCGDFNAIPISPSYALLAKRMTDAQRQLKGHRPKATWLSGRPINRIDHVFLSEGIEVHGITVPRTDLARVASDHLPLIVEVHFVAERCPATVEVAQCSQGGCQNAVT